MPESAHSSTKPMRGWRGQPAVRRPSASSRLAGRLLFSGLALGLAAILGWILIRWWFLPDVYFVALPVVDYDVLAVPPIPYIQEDLDAFSAVAPHGRATALRELEISENMPRLVDRLQGIVTRPRDTLILYVSAYGISDDGVAYVLCSDYLRTRGQARYPLRELLGQIEKSRAALKLVLFDPGPLRADPRQGMLVNEFPRLLEEEVVKVNDPRLWVFAANRPLEVSHCVPSIKRSVFGECVTKGLAGAADRNGNGVIELDELTDFARANVSRWVSLQTHDRDAQTPWLLQGGVGPAQAPAGLELLPVRRPTATAETEAEASASSAATDSPPSQQSRSTARLRQLLRDAWTMCDKARQREGDEGWTPIDYAPHLWREYEELLLGYELRCRGGAAYSPDELAREIQTNLLPLNNLLTRGELPPGLGSSTVLARLEAARRQFLSGEVRRSYQQLPADFAVLRKAVQLKNDLLDRAPDYVRWHALASPSASQPLPLLEPISELLSKRLPEFLSLLKSWEATDSSAPLSMAVASERLKLLQDKMRELETLRTRIEQDGLEQEVRELVKNRGKSENSGPMEDLLGTPLLRAELRSQLLDALNGPGAFLTLSAVLEREEREPAAPTWRWDRLSKQAGIEVALASLIDPQSRTAIEWPPQGLQPNIASGGESKAAEAWVQYRRLGKQLGALYQGLPDRIRADASTASPDSLRAAEGLLRLLDARDSGKIAPDAVQWAVRPAPRISLPTSTLLLAGPDKLELRPEQWTGLELTVKASGPMEGPGTVRLQYDPAALEIATAEATTPVAADQDIAFSPGPGGVATFRYRARPRIATATKTPLTITARGSGQTATRTIEMTVSPPDVVDFVVRGMGGTVESRTDDPEHILLCPFPNRVTDYRFELINRSGRKRKVQVQVLAVSQPLSERRVSRELPLDTLGNTRPGVRKIGDVPLELPAESSPVPIPFPVAAPPKEAKPSEAKNNETKPGAEEPKKPPPIPATAGIVCIVRDAAQPDRQWVRWLDFAPLAPKDYLDASVSYDSAQQRLTVQVQPRDTDGDGKPNPESLPPLSPEEPIEVVWDSAGSLAPDTEMNDRASLVPPNYRASLFARVPPRSDRYVWVRLMVDGYPRAFVYHPRCDQDRQQIPRERSLPRVQITVPRADQAFRAPLDRLPVEFQVDAPEDAFQQEGDAVQIGIDEDGSRRFAGRPVRQFSADRQVEVLVQETSPTGLVKINAKVHDFKTELMPGGLQNKRVDVVARLTLTNRGAGPDRPIEDAVSVVLDGSPPELHVDPVASPIAVGAPLVVSGHVEDLSGVEKVEIGFDLEGKEKPKTLQQLGGPTADWRTSLETKDLEPGRYRLFVRATDRVGLVSPPLTQVVTLSAPMPGAGPADKALAGKMAKHAIEGRVLLGDRPCPNIEVRLEGAGHATRTDENGKFAFKDLPPGKYTLKATGAVLNRFRKGSSEVTLPAGQEPASVEIHME